MASFLTRRRLFAKSLTARMPAPYLFDLLALLLVLSAWFGIDDLRGFSRGDAVVTTPTTAFALIGALGIYGVRLAIWSAILRRNRMPQTIEWLLCLVPLAAAIACFAFSGAMVRAYASVQGYHRCADRHVDGTLYVFAAAGRACPAEGRVADGASDANSP